VRSRRASVVAKTTPGIQRAPELPSGFEIFGVRRRSSQGTVADCKTRRGGNPIAAHLRDGTRRASRSRVQAPWRVAFESIARTHDGVSRAELDASSSSRFRVYSATSLPRERDLIAALVQDGRLSLLRAEPSTEDHLDWLVFGPAEPLDDAWVMLRTPRRKLWLELPYGLWVDPRRGAVNGPQLGPPRPPPGLGRTDEPLAWTRVSADLGEIGARARFVVEEAHHGQFSIELAAQVPDLSIALVPERAAILPPRIEQVSAWHFADDHTCRARFAVAISEPAVRSCYTLHVRTPHASIERAAIPSSLLDRRHPPASRGGGESAL